MTNPFYAPKRRGPTSGASFDVPPAARARFSRRVEVRSPSECWPYLGVIMPSGYGSMTITVNGVRRPVGAHRIAYRIAKGPIPDGKVVMHACDNPRCVNPAHLSLGTHRENVADMIAKGRQVVSSERARLAECVRGHELGAFNRSWPSVTCRFCEMLRRAETAAVAEDAFREWVAEHVWPLLPDRFSDLVERFGERDAQAFCHWAGCFDHALLSVEDVARTQGVSRQRIDQRKSRVLAGLGIKSKTPNGRYVRSSREQDSPQDSAAA